MHLHTHTNKEHRVFFVLRHTFLRLADDVASLLTRALRDTRWMLHTFDAMFEQRFHYFLIMSVALCDVGVGKQTQSVDDADADV